MEKRTLVKMYEEEDGTVLVFDNGSKLKVYKQKKKTFFSWIVDLVKSWIREIRAKNN